MSYAFRCGVCGGLPRWRLLRRGDVVVSWADDRHLTAELLKLQRDQETEIIVTVSGGFEQHGALMAALEERFS